MHALIVVSHPDPESLTHAVAHSFAQGVAQSGDHTTETADIAAEGFQAAFNQVDRSAYFLQGPLPSDVVREQARIDRADALVLIYPVYWWSFPGQLKGWIDRVFANGWAYDEAPDGTLDKRLGRLAVHLIGIGGADGSTYARHGYEQAMRTQIDHGIFDFCGARVVTSELLLGVNGQGGKSHLVAAQALGGKAFARSQPQQVSDCPRAGAKALSTADAR